MLRPQILAALDNRRPAVDLEVLIPARNEEARLPATLDAVVRYLEGLPIEASVVVVDNGSTDGTAAVAETSRGGGRVPVYVITCPQPGKGAAVRKGVLTSRARFVGFTDADLATPIETVDRVLPLLQAGAPVVIGSRRAPGAWYAVDQPLGRRVGGWVFRTMVAAVLRGHPDTQCGFKFFDGTVARHLFSEGRTTGFAFDVELLAVAHRIRCDVAEVPVVWTDCEGSTFHPVRDGLKSAAELALIGLRSATFHGRLPRTIARPDVAPAATAGSALRH